MFRETLSVAPCKVDVAELDLRELAIALTPLVSNEISGHLRQFTGPKRPFSEESLPRGEAHGFTPNEVSYALRLYAKDEKPALRHRMLVVLTDITAGHGLNYVDQVYQKFQDGSCNNQADSYIQSHRLGIRSVHIRRSVRAYF